MQANYIVRLVCCMGDLTMNIEIGVSNTIKAAVNESNIAKEVKSGSLEVFATPCMIALFEQAASELCEKYLDEGQTTVGTMVNIEHLAASAVGSQIKATAKVTAVEGRKICFEVQAFDNAGLIGKGTHERFIVFSERFMSKAQARLFAKDK